jgi:hypothetical protein
MHHRIMVGSERESKNEIARFGVLNLPIPAISNAASSEIQTPAQSLRALFTDDYKEAAGGDDARRIDADAWKKLLRPACGDEL